jgi:hypothetical protein
MNIKTIHKSFVFVYIQFFQININYGNYHFEKETYNTQQISTLASDFSI